MFDGVVAAGRVRVADRAIAFSGLREPIQGDTNAYETAMRVLIRPVGFDPVPRFVDRIHANRRIAWGILATIDLFIIELCQFCARRRAEEEGASRYAFCRMKVGVHRPAWASEFPPT